MTNPDRRAGRGLGARRSPVKEVALEAGLEVLQPESARDPALHERLRALDLEVAVVVAYGKILPPSLLEIPRLGFVNVHFSLLPAYRGAAPVQRAIIEGASETGVSIIVLTEGLDEGPVLARRAVPIGPDESAGELGDRLAALGAEVLVEALGRYAGGELEPQAQDDGAATYAPKISDEEARIDWSRPARAVRDLARGCDPEPGAWTTLRGRRLKVFRARVAPAPDALGAGELIVTRGLYAGCGDQPLLLESVQMEGRRRMSGEELARGLRLAPGERLQ